MTKLALVVLAVVALVAAQSSDPNVRTTDKGQVRGAVIEGVRSWFGIPFAAPPIDDNRFRPPQPASAWAGVRAAEVPLERACPQFFDFFGRSFGNEDCLYLDVYAPVDATPTSRLPVMVWIYGGGWTIGDKLEAGLYEASNLVKENGERHVHVAMNYRLGALGFMALDSLAREANGTTGSYGLQDQRAALEWVQRNVGAFGGDATRVTIFGESAGAFSVCYHLASPPSRSLFRAAIMESGSCDAGEFFRPLDLATQWSNEVARAHGCVDPSSELECLRRVSAAAFIQPTLPTTPGAYDPVLNPFMPWAAAIDGTEQGLLDTPLALLQRGAWGKQPLIIGTNNDEGTLLAFGGLVSIFKLDPLTLDAAQLTRVLERFWNTSAVQMIVEKYDTVHSSQFQKMANILTDYFFACSARRTVAAYDAHGADAYLYHFTYLPQWIDDRLLGDYHSAELEFVFDNAWPPLFHAFNAKDHAMANYFGQYWTNFATTLQPNGDHSNASLPTWPRWTASSAKDMRLDVPPNVEDDYMHGMCEFWSSIYLKQGNGHLRSDGAADAATFDVGDEQQRARVAQLIKRLRRRRHLVYASSRRRPRVSISEELQQ